MESIRTYLSSLPFNFQNASIITGQEEGLYGWVTANYLKGNLLEVIHWAYCTFNFTVRFQTTNLC